MKDKKLPIGYYVKQVDKLLTEKINAVQSQFGLTRTSWQILNSIHAQDTMKREELVNFMLQLTGKETVDEILLKFTWDGIVNIEKENLFSLTDKGKNLFKDCSEKQNEFRRKSMKHVSEEDYQTTISTLEQIIKNLE
jgi:hypothetical protein